MTLVEQSREPLRPVVADDAALSECVDALAGAQGPIGFDVERAHGYRYWPRAYLFQIRRGTAGTWLIDPTKFDPAQLSALVQRTGDEEWIIHAASQDLPSMFEAGIAPSRIFDSELAARLLGKPGASLGALLASELDIELRKEHSAVNWALRPLKESWLTYAALDVDYLAELRDVLDTSLREMHRREWAEQEFEWELQEYSRAAEPKEDPWRRTSRITAVRHPRGLALLRELWLEREAIAQRRDRPPRHIAPDQALVDAGRAAGKDRPVSADLLRRIPGFTSPPGSRYMTNWKQAVDRFLQLDSKDYPPKRRHTPGALPHPKSWLHSNEQAGFRWAKARPAVDGFACEIGVQPSLLAPPAALQQVLWHHAQPAEQDLLAAGMRPWQADLLSGLFRDLFG